MRRAWQWASAVSLALSCTPMDQSALKVQVQFPPAPRIQAIPGATRAVPILVVSGGQVVDKVVLTSLAPTAIFRGLPLGQVEVFAAAFSRQGAPLAVGKTNGLIEQNVTAKAQVELQELSAANLSTLQSQVDQFKPFQDLIQRVLDTLPAENLVTATPAPTQAPSGPLLPTPIPTLNPGTQPPTASNLQAVATPTSGFPAVLTATVSDPDSTVFRYSIRLKNGSRTVTYSFDGANWVLTTPTVTASVIPLVSTQPSFTTTLLEGNFGRPSQSGDAFSVVWLAPTVSVSTTFEITLTVSDGAQSATSNTLSVSLSPPSNSSGSAGVGF